VSVSLALGTVKNGERSTIRARSGSFGFEHDFAVMAGASQEIVAPHGPVSFA
jgi:hypothetical protein